jgi:hypothetical protein
MTTSTSIERNSFDYARAYAESQSTNPTVVAELEQACVLIAQNLGISMFEFIQLMQQQGTSQQQALYLAAQLNSVRPRNALLGLPPNLNTPNFISREIAA